MTDELYELNQTLDKNNNKKAKSHCDIHCNSASKFVFFGFFNLFYFSHQYFFFNFIILN